MIEVFFYQRKHGRTHLEIKAQLLAIRIKTAPYAKLNHGQITVYVYNDSVKHACYCFITLFKTT